MRIPQNPTLLPVVFLAIISLLLSAFLKDDIFAKPFQKSDMGTQTNYNDTYLQDMPTDTTLPTHMEVSPSPESQSSKVVENEHLKRVTVAFSQKRLQRQIEARKKVEKVGALVGFFVLGVLGWFVGC